LLAASSLAVQRPARPRQRQLSRRNNYNYSDGPRAASRAVTGAFRARQDDLPGRCRGRDENGKPGDIRHKDDFVAQCRYRYDKIKRALEKNGAGFGDIVKIVSYVTECASRPTTAGAVRQIFGANAAAGPHAP